MKSATLDKFFEMKKENSYSGDILSKELEFTGNWFIDAGILGFVNLMEEVYGWDLDNLRKYLAGSNNDRLSSVFAYAFWYRVIKDTTKRWLEKEIFESKNLKKETGIDLQELKENIKNEILEEIYRKNYSLRKNVVEGKNLDVKEIIIKDVNDYVKKLIEEKFSNYKSYLRKVFGSRNNKKTIVDNSKSIGIIGYLEFFTNLNIFNPSSNKSGKENKILYDFEKLVKDGFVRKGKKYLPTDVVDKALSPFVYSASEFPNEYYGSPMTLQSLKKVSALNPAIYILCIPFSFVEVMNKNYLFYTPDLEFTYNVNKKLKEYVEIATNLSDKSKSIFKLTWSAILDTLIEYKSQFSIENMYILEFSGIQNQQLQNVEYIGIPKLQASIILEDTIRDALNVDLEIDQNEVVWVLEEFIKNKPLYDTILGHVLYNLRKKNETAIKRKASLYALAIDAKMRERNAKTQENRVSELFSNDFFKEYRTLVSEIKDCYETLSNYTYLISKLFDSREEIQKICYALISAIRRKNRIAFVNTLLKKFLEKAGSKEVLSLNRFIFENIVSNDISWENYGLSLVIGILSYGGVESGEESELEE